MDKEEKKKINKELEQKQLELEKEFHKTLGGKFIRTLLYIAVMFLILGLILAFLYHAFKLEQSVKDMAGHFITFGGRVSLFGAVFYSIWLPMFKREKKKKK